MTGDRWLRYGTAAAVLFVAGIAATVSFVHIQHLALTYGQTPLAAILLPLSIDGTVVASSMALLRAARLSVPAPWLGQAMLASAVVATLAANVGYGWQWGWAGAALSGWPAYAFIGCTEMAIGMVRRTARRVPAAVPAAGKAPPILEIRERRKCGQRAAEVAQQEVRLYARTYSNGHREGGVRA